MLPNWNSILSSCGPNSFRKEETYLEIYFPDLNVGGRYDSGLWSLPQCIFSELEFVMLPNHLFSATPIGPLLPGDQGLPSLSARRTNGGFLSGFQLYTTCPHLLRDLFLLLARQAREKRRNMLMIYIIHIFSIYTSCIVFPFRATLEELILRIGLVAGAIFSRIAQ